jgi:hypothetical protein
VTYQGILRRANRAMLIFQIGTNNWQRQGEFAPGSGILHASFHDARQVLNFWNVSCCHIHSNP